MADDHAADATDRPTATDPPIVKAIAARGVAIQLIIAQLAELAGIGAITYALIVGRLTEQTFGMLFGALMSGTIVGKMRGKSVVPLTSLLVTVAPSLAKGGAAATAARHVFTLLVLPIAAVIALASCSVGNAPPPEPLPPIEDPVLDAGPSCARACKNIDALHCDGFAPDGGTCKQGCANLTASIPAPHLLTCLAKALTCVDARNCQE